MLELIDFIQLITALNLLIKSNLISIEIYPDTNRDRFLWSDRNPSDWSQKQICLHQRWWSRFFGVTRCISSPKIHPCAFAQPITIGGAWEKHAQFLGLHVGQWPLLPPSSQEIPTYGSFWGFRDRKET